MIYTIRQRAMLARMQRFYPLFWQYIKEAKPIDPIWLSEIAEWPPRERLLVPRLERLLASSQESEREP
jgi:hypothetical protein